MKGTVIVTGGNGFIGSHVIERLVGMDYDVISIDPRHQGNLIVNDSRVDYSDSFTQATPLDRWLKSDGVTHIVHLGAWSNVRESMRQPNQIYLNNTLSTSHILQCVFNAGDKSRVKSIVFASSSAVESPESHYGVSKLASEMMLDVFREQMKGEVSVSSLRFGNVYGPRQNPGNGTLIAKFIQHILEGTTPTVYGDGSQTRDYIYVSDVVNAIILCMEFEPDGMEVGLSDTMNCSTGCSWSVNEVYDKTKEALESTSIMVDLEEPEYVDARAGDKAEVNMRPSETLLNAGWSADTPLKDGIWEQLNWANSMKGSWTADHYIDGSMV